MKVGDKVRVVDSVGSHEFKLGDIVECRYIEADGDHGFTDGRECWFMNKREYEPINTLELNGTYTSKNGEKWECIAVKGDVAWLAVVFDEYLGTAYRYKLDGSPIDLKHPKDTYQIVFSPVTETKSTDITIGGKTATIEYDTKDGEADLSTIRVVSI